MKKQNIPLLDLEVTRKEFLIYVSVALLGLFGIDNFLNLLSGQASPGPASRTQNVGEAGDSGFGTRKFGV